jgi:hypothetical protein
MIETYHVRSGDALPLVAARVADLFGIGTTAEHESIQVAGGVYYAAASAALRLKVQVEDTIGFGDFDYEITFRNQGAQVESIDVRRLCQAFGSVARCVSFDGHQVTRREFSLDPTGALTVRTETFSTHERKDTR